MKCIFKIIITLILVATATFIGMPAFADSGRWESWSEASASFKPDDKNEIRLEKAIRFNQGKMYYTHSDLHFRHRLGDSFKAGLGYRLVDYRSENRWNKEHRPYGLGILETRAGSFKLENRHKMEYRMKPAESGLWRYRSRVKVTLPVKIGKQFRVKPYIADEIFLYLNGQDRFEIYRNRLSTGIDVPLGDDSDVEFFYLAQTQEIDLEEGEVWRRYNVIGIKLKLYF